ncbi:MAG: hypothetical protein ACYCQL_00475 [Acidithiobacillus sp.]
MSYGRMECGAVPGYKDRPTGPVTLYSISANGAVSRTLNRAERMAEAAELEKEVAKLEEDLERKIVQVQEAIAKKYLAFFLELLAPFNLHNHTVQISAGMGCANVMVGTKFLFDYPDRPFPVIDVLKEIDQMIEGQNWAYHLHDEVLNQKAPQSATPEFTQQAM